MKLYCYNCCETHEFTCDQVEHIVYALQGGLADARLSPAFGDQIEMDCLLDVLESADDIECYGEHVSAMVLRRKQCEREIDAQLAEADR